MDKKIATYKIRLWHSGVGEPVNTVWKLVQILTESGFPIQYEAGKERPLKSREDVLNLFKERQKRKEGKVDYGVGISVHNLLTAPPREQPLAFNFTAGSRNPKHIDAFLLKLPGDKDVFSKIISIDTFDSIFREWVKVIHPFWGVVIQSANERRHLGLDQSFKDSFQRLEAYPINLVDARKVPQLIHWFSYFGHEFVDRLGGEEKLLGGPVYQAEKLGEGVLWVLQEEPFDDENDEHRTRQEAASKYLNLEQIQKTYMKSLPEWPAQNR